MANGFTQSILATQPQEDEENLALKAQDSGIPLVPTPTGAAAVGATPEQAAAAATPYGKMAARQSQIMSNLQAAQQTRQEEAAKKQPKEPSVTEAQRVAFEKADRIRKFGTLSSWLENQLAAGKIEDPGKQAIFDVNKEITAEQAKVNELVGLTPEQMDAMIPGWRVMTTAQLSLAVKAIKDRDYSQTQALMNKLNDPLATTEEKAAARQKLVELSQSGQIAAEEAMRSAVNADIAVDEKALTKKFLETKAPDAGQQAVANLAAPNDETNPIPVVDSGAGPTEPEAAGSKAPAGLSDDASAAYQAALQTDKNASTTTDPVQIQAAFDASATLASDAGIAALAGISVPDSGFVWSAEDQQKIAKAVDFKKKFDALNTGKDFGGFVNDISIGDYVKKAVANGTLTDEDLKLLATADAGGRDKFADVQEILDTMTGDLSQPTNANAAIEGVLDLLLGQQASLADVGDKYKNLNSVPEALLTPTQLTAKKQLQELDVNKDNRIDAADAPGIKNKFSGMSVADRTSKTPISTLNTGDISAMSGPEEKVGLRKHDGSILDINDTTSTAGKLLQSYLHDFRVSDGRNTAEEMKFTLGDWVYKANALGVSLKDLVSVFKTVKPENMYYTVLGKIKDKSKATKERIISFLQTITDQDIAAAVTANKELKAKAEATTAAVNKNKLDEQIILGNIMGSVNRTNDWLTLSPAADGPYWNADSLKQANAAISTLSEQIRVGDAPNKPPYSTVLAKAKATLQKYNDKIKQYKDAVDTVNTKIKELEIKELNAKISNPGIAHFYTEQIKALMDQRAPWTKALQDIGA